MQMLSPLPLATSSNTFDQTTFTLEEFCSTATHLALAFLPKPLTYIVTPLLTGIGLLKIFSSPETGKERENNLTRFIAHLSPISADLIALYDLCLGAYHLIGGIKDLLFQESDKSLLPGIKNILISGITLFADYRLAMRCYSAVENKKRSYEAKAAEMELTLKTTEARVAQMELTLKTTTQKLSMTLKALAQTIFKFRASRQQNERKIGGLNNQLANVEIALERSRGASSRNLQNQLALQNVMRGQLDQFAREKSNFYNALQLAEERIAKLERRLSTLSIQMTTVRTESNVIEMKNRRLESLAIILGKALRKEKIKRQELMVAVQSEHLAALQRNILQEAVRNSSGTLPTPSPTLLLRGVQMHKLAAAYNARNKLSIVS